MLISVFVLCNITHSQLYVFDALNYYQTYWSIQKFSVNLENNRDAYEGVTIEYKAYVDMFVKKRYYSYISLA